jgi:hypothetical protein
VVCEEVKDHTQQIDEMSRFFGGGGMTFANEGNKWRQTSGGSSPLSEYLLGLENPLDFIAACCSLTPKEEAECYGSVILEEVD